MINNLSGHAVQDYTVNQQASQTTQPTITASDSTTISAVEEETTGTPSTIVTLGTAPDIPITYSTSGGIGKPPP